MSTSKQRRAGRSAVLQEVERRPTIFIQRHYFPVHHCFIGERGECF
jgi:hypothetical protein